MSHIGDYVSRIIPLLVCCVLVSCGYTQLQRHVQEAPKPPAGPIPDLAITHIEHFTYERYGSHGPSQPMTKFSLYIRNVGVADFEGSTMFNYTPDWRDIERNRYPFAGGLGRRKIAAGDSTIVVLDHWGQFPPGIRLHFLLRTDSYYPHAFHPVDYFGREPVHEESYQNNEMDYLIE
ncbi:MAG: hypothetical protein KF749_04190 [Bacteroidetes bacterium]|nr:hypothetical protein [Bacteroidota bacterium]MCW5897196.1 hypothetical protein [Bacteroidota bacterium]